MDNLVLALIMASMGLLDDIPIKGKKPIAAGQPYFICDGKRYTAVMCQIKSLVYVLVVTMADRIFVWKIH